MAILPIVNMESPVLHQKAKRVSSLDRSVQKLIDDMIETMHNAGGVGLAAPQIGKPLRLVVIQLPDDEEAITLVNPEIVKKSGERVVTEGCLSLPGYRGDIKRALSVTVKGQDRNGRPVRIKAQDLLAQALEHELDHINGVVYIDHLEDKSKLQKITPEEQSE